LVSGEQYGTIIVDALAPSVIIGYISKSCALRGCVWRIPQGSEEAQRACQA